MDILVLCTCKPHSAFSPVASEPAAPTTISALSSPAPAPAPGRPDGEVSVHSRSVVSAEHDTSSPAAVHSRWCTMPCVSM